jgi:hypothetical protein
MSYAARNVFGGEELGKLVAEGGGSFDLNRFCGGALDEELGKLTAEEARLLGSQRCRSGALDEDLGSELTAEGAGCWGEGFGELRSN